MKKLGLTLQTECSPVMCMQKLYEAIDIQKRSLLSLSGYQGERTVLVRHSPSARIRLQKRRYWRNDFAPILYAKTIPRGGGTRIEAYFDMRYEVRVFTRCWLIFVGVIGSILLFSFLSDVHSASQDLRDGVLIVSAMFLFEFPLPRIGAWLSFAEKGFLAELLV